LIGGTIYAQLSTHMLRDFTSFEFICLVPAVSTVLFAWSHNMFFASGMLSCMPEYRHSISMGTLLLQSIIKTSHIADLIVHRKLMLLSLSGTLHIRSSAGSWSVWQLRPHARRLGWWACSSPAPYTWWWSRPCFHCGSTRSSSSLLAASAPAFSRSPWPSSSRG